MPVRSHHVVWSQIYERVVRSDADRGDCDEGACSTELDIAWRDAMRVALFRATFLLDVILVHFGQVGTLLVIACAVPVCSSCAQLFLVSEVVPFLMDSLQDAAQCKVACSSILRISSELNILIVVKFIALPIVVKVARTGSPFALSTALQLANVLGDKIVAAQLLPFTLSMITPSSKKIALTRCLLKLVAGLMRNVHHFDLLQVAVLNSNVLFRVFVEPPMQSEDVFAEVVKLLMEITKAVGQEAAMKYILPRMKGFFVDFDRCFQTSENDEESYNVLHEDPIHNRATACLVYSQMCQFLGQMTMRREIPNSDLIEMLMYEHLQHAREEEEKKGGAEEKDWAASEAGSDAKDSDLDTSQDAPANASKAQVTSPHSPFLTPRELPAANSAVSTPAGALASPLGVGDTKRSMVDHFGSLPTATPDDVSDSTAPATPPPSAAPQGSLQAQMLLAANTPLTEVGHQRQHASALHARVRCFVCLVACLVQSTGGASKRARAQQLPTTPVVVGDPLATSSMLIPHKSRLGALTEVPNSSRARGVC